MTVLYIQREITLCDVSLLYDSLTNFAKYKIIQYALICNFSMHTFPGSNSLEFRGIQPGALMKS